jgi:hypothetical protein
LLAFVRVACVTGVFILTGVLMSNQNVSDNAGLVFPTGVPHANETSSLMFLPAVCFQGDSHLLDTLQDSVSSSQQFFVNAIGNSTPKNKIQGWRWYLIILFFYGAAVLAEFIRFCRRGQNRPGWRRRMGTFLRRYVGTGTRSRAVFKYVFLLYLVAGVGIGSVTVVVTSSYIFDLRSWVNASGWVALGNNNVNPENDATSFGQLVPIFLSALILFSFLQTISGQFTPSPFPLPKLLSIVLTPVKKK